MLPPCSTEQSGWNESEPKAAGGCRDGDRGMTQAERRAQECIVLHSAHTYDFPYVPYAHDMRLRTEVRTTSFSNTPMRPLKPAKSASVFTILTPLPSCMPSVLYVVNLLPRCNVPSSAKMRQAKAAKASSFSRTRPLPAQLSAFLQFSACRASAS